MLQQILGLLSGGGQPAQAASPRVQAPQKQGEPAGPSATTTTTTNAEHSPNAVAMAAVKPEAIAPTIDSQKSPANENLTMLQRAIESLAKTFGVSLSDLTQSLLKAQPDLVKAIVGDALKAVIPQQQPAAQAPAVA